MTPSELTDEFRRQVMDTKLPYLWQPIEVFNYMAEAQDMFVRMTDGIRDSSSRSLTDVRVKTGVAYAALSPYILDVRGGWLTGAQTPVKFIKEADLAAELTSDYGFVTHSTSLADEEQGTVTHAITGLTDGKVRWFKVPSEDDVCRMQLVRLPYPRMVMGSDDPGLEVREEHHRALLLWMKYLAYSKEDPETFNAKLRDESYAAFVAYADRGKAETERRRAKRNEVHYGGL